MQIYIKKAKKDEKPMAYHHIFRKAFLGGLCGLFALCAHVALAQDGATTTEHENIHFGVQAGGGVHTSYPDKNSPWTFERPKTKVGFDGGAFFQWDFTKSRQWFLHFELGVGSSQLQAFGTSADTAYETFNIKAGYVDLMPGLGVGYFFFPRTESLNLSLSTCVVGHFPTGNGDPMISVHRQDLTGQSYYKSMGFRLETGIYYEFFCLALRYEHEVLPIMQVNGPNFSQKFGMGHFEFLLRFTIF